MSMGNISEAIEDSAKSKGVEIRTRALVEKVIVEGGAAKGVRLANGEEIRSFIVASNADPKRTFKTMFQTEELDEDTLKRMDSWKTTAGCVKFLAAMDELPDLTRYLGSSYDANSIINIKIMPSVEYHKQSWRDAANGKVSSCPVMNIQIPSTVEPNLVKGKGHVMSNWVLFEPPTLEDSTWEAERENVGEQIIDVISQYAPNFRNSLVDWTLQTPEDIEGRVGMTDGNIRHLDMIPNQLLSQRQPYRTSIDNFYMCGAGTHPMGEVTGAPGHNAANAILKDLDRKAV
jgi:phytoene dehydrogenase-like protein